MKISIRTTLLSMIVLLFVMSNTQAQNNNYNRTYRTVENKASANRQTVDSDNDDIRTIARLKAKSLDAATIAELDSLLKNRIGVRRIKQGRKSILKLELDQTSKASLTLLGCVELGNRYPETGKAIPDPEIGGLPVVKKKLDGSLEVPTALTNMISNVSTNKTDKESETPTITPRSESQPYRTTTSGYNPVSQPYKASTASSESSSLSKQFGQPKIFTKMSNIVLTNESDKAFFKKYSIVLGTFTNDNSADFVRRTFNALGERVIIVKNSSGMLFALLASYDIQAEAEQKLDVFSKKYTEGMSRSRRIGKYGIPLDDLWILVKD